MWIGVAAAALAAFRFFGAGVTGMAWLAVVVAVAAVWAIGIRSNFSHDLQGPPAIVGVVGLVSTGAAAILALLSFTV